jgi:hypothetical protein
LPLTNMPNHPMEMIVLLFLDNLHDFQMCLRLVSLIRWYIYVKSSPFPSSLELADKERDGLGPVT